MGQYSSKPTLLNNDKTPIFIYCLSTVFMVFFSVSAIHYWSEYWAQISILSACLTPFLLILIRFLVHRDEAVEFRREIGFVLVVGLLGAVNILLSEAQWITFKAMSLFLMSGMGIYLVSSVLFREKRNIIVFYYLCTLCFVFVVAWGLFEFIQGVENPSQRIHLFSSNPIPAGSLIILLSVGPLLQIPQSSRGVKYSLVASLVLGGVLIFLIGQRGPVFALIVMLAITGMAKFKKFWVFLLVVILLLGASFAYKESLPNLYQGKLENWDSALIRLEYYNVAFQVIKDHPLFGVGFSAPIANYIPPDYEPVFYPTDRKLSFSSITRGVQTFDNMILCFIAEAGTLFMLVYLWLFVYVFRSSFGLIKSAPDSRYVITVIWALLVGFLAHSMTFDSLRYPQLNWMFHSIMGLAINLRFLYNAKVF